MNTAKTLLQKTLQAGLIVNGAEARRHHLRRRRTRAEHGDERRFDSNASAAGSADRFLEAAGRADAEPGPHEPDGQRADPTSQMAHRSAGSRRSTPRCSRRARSSRSCRRCRAGAGRPRRHGARQDRLVHRRRRRRRRPSARRPGRPREAGGAGRHRPRRHTLQLGAARKAGTQSSNGGRARRRRHRRQLRITANSGHRHGSTTTLMRDRASTRSAPTTAP